MTFETKNNQIRITDLNGISHDMWHRLQINLKHIGYDFRDEQDVYDYFSRKTWLQPDQSRVFLAVLNDVHTSSYTPETAENDTMRVTEAFGTTYDMSLCGYITINGDALNFSYDGHTRNIDHRDLNDLIEAENEDGGNSAEMLKFIAYGNIRVTNNGISIMLPPNSKQLRRIADHIRYVRRHNDGYTVDIMNTDGMTVKSLIYDHPSAETIINDVNSYFKDIIVLPA
jgi:hypothetical protein